MKIALKTRQSNFINFYLIFKKSKSELIKEKNNYKQFIKFLIFTI